MPLIVLNRALARAKVRPLLKEVEGVRLVAYRCPAGHWTVGFGHRIGRPMVATGAQIEEWLTRDIEAAEKEIGEEVIRRLNTNQLAAILSFVFNIGGAAWRNSTMRRMILAGNMFAAGEEFKRWNKAMVNGQLVVLPGLTIRREAERTLFDCARELN